MHTHLFILQLELFTYFTHLSYYVFQKRKMNVSPVLIVVVFFNELFTLSVEFRDGRITGWPDCCRYLSGFARWGLSDRIPGLVSSVISSVICEHFDWKLCVFCFFFLNNFFLCLGFVFRLLKKKKNLVDPPDSDHQFVFSNKITLSISPLPPHTCTASLFVVPKNLTLILFSTS